MNLFKKRGGIIIACVIVVAVLGTGVLLAMNTNKPLDKAPRHESQMDAEGNPLNYLEQLPETNKLVLYRNIFNYYLLDPAVKIFQWMYPGVEVEVRDFVDSIREYYDVIQTEISSGKGPDLLVMSDTSDFPDIYKVMDADVFCDLNDFIGGDPGFSLEDYNKAVMDSGVYKGKRYVAPINHYRNILLTSEETLAAAGMVAESFSTFAGYAGEIRQFLERNGSTKLVYNQQQQYFYMLFPWCGINYIDYETKTVNIEGEDFKKVMDAYRDIYAQDWEPSDITNITHFMYLIPDTLRSDKILFGGENSGFYSTLKNFMAYYGALDAYGYTPAYFPFPSANGKKITKAGIMAAVLNSSPNKLNAYRFLKILLSEQIQSADAADMPLLYFPVLNDAIAIKAKKQRKIKIGVTALRTLSNSLNRVRRENRLSKI